MRALESALPALKKYRVPNIVVEWFPRRWDWNGISVSRGIALLEQLHDMGYKIFIYNLNLQYDVKELRQIKVGGGIIWEIPREKIAHMHEYLMDPNKASYGEANLWLSDDIMSYMA